MYDSNLSWVLLGPDIIEWNRGKNEDAFNRNQFVGCHLVLVSRVDGLRRIK